MTRIDSAVRLTLDGLWVSGDLEDDDSEVEPPRKGLHELTEPQAHIHGLLVIEINWRFPTRLGGGV